MVLKINIIIIYSSRKNVHFEQSQKVLTQRTDGVMMIDITQSS